ncbi:MAG TPA: hypothetical protein VFK39_10465 [Gemmatimonadaceae bacterium]|nr:hypothetical protein [Gemmatimonadaceae bacterium]
MTYRTVIRAAAVVAALGCAGQPNAAAQADLPAQRPLAAFVSRPVLVLPARFLGGDGALGWGAQIGDPDSYLGELDAEIAFAMKQRGVDKQWILPPAIVRSVRRNPGFATDPHDLSADWLRPPLEKPPEQMPEPFASQVRSLVALQEGAQYVLYPVEVRFEPLGAADGQSSGGPADGKGAAGAHTQGRAVLRVALIDARRQKILWMADVVSDPYPSFSPALAASVAEHLVDLIAKR